MAMTGNSFLKAALDENIQQTFDRVDEQSQRKKLDVKKDSDLLV